MGCATEAQKRLFPWQHTWDNHVSIWWLWRAKPAETLSGTFLSVSDGPSCVFSFDLPTKTDKHKQSATHRPSTHQNGKNKSEPQTKNKQANKSCDTKRGDQGTTKAKG